MMKTDSCCGQPQRRRRMGPAQEPLPANPSLIGGVAMIYLGSGRREIHGSRSGHRYFVADQRRHFRAAPSDVDDLLRDREFMLKV